MTIMGSVCRSKERAAPSSRNSINSNTTYTRHLVTAFKRNVNQINTIGVPARTSLLICYPVILKTVLPLTRYPSDHY